MTHAESTGPPTSRPRVLLVEDDHSIRSALRELLEDAGISVVGEATDGEAGIRQAELLDPDVVTLDLRMPVMGGIEAAKEIKKVSPSTEVIILTAYDDPTLSEAADGAGVYCYIVKGHAPRFLVDAIRRAHDARNGLQPGAAIVDPPADRAS
jgi:NarL family two-component system response regulator LiaR